MKPLLVTALGAALLLTGCAQTPAPEPEPTQKSQPSEAEPAPEQTQDAGTGAMPDWAAGAVDVGEKIGSTSTENWQVDIYQVGTAKTERDSMFVDSETNTNLLPAGSEVVFLNFVYTNTSGETINVGNGFGMPDVRTSDWAYMTGMPGESSSEAFEALGLANNIVKPGAITDYNNVQLPVASGQSVPVATSLKYTPGSSATVHATMVPVDGSGHLDHDRTEKVADDFTFTIK